MNVIEPVEMFKSVIVYLYERNLSNSSRPFSYLLGLGKERFEQKNGWMDRVPRPGERRRSQNDREGVSAGRTNEMTFGTARSRLVHLQVVRAHRLNRRHITASK
jgi:hypothetical protein